MVTRAITHWMIRYNAITEEEEELYVYALQSLFYSVAPMILFILAGFILGQVIYGIVLSIPFCMIRRYSGGYHAPYGWMCILMSMGLLLFCFWVQSYIPCDFRLFLFTILALISLGIMSPVDSENRPLDPMEMKRYKKSTIVSSLVCEVFYLVAWIFEWDRCAAAIAIGIILAAVLQLPCIPRLIKK